MYQAEPCPLCGETLWNGKCENPDCHYHWHPKDDEEEDDESNPGKLHRTDDDD